MGLPLWMENLILRAIDSAFDRWPRKQPHDRALKACKLVAHRGDFDNQTVFENTIPAFERAVAGGVWGIEFDVRWTRDLHPVVFHDSDLQRLYGSAHKIAHLTLSELQADHPDIPSLDQVIGRCGKSSHLMVEIKQEHYPDPCRQRGILGELFQRLEPQVDYHFMSLTPLMMETVGFSSLQTCLPIARLNIRELSKMAIARGYRGLTGHYLLVTNRILNTHRRLGQPVGTGFVNSTRCLFRELNRGVEWIFSNNAVTLQRAVRDLATGSG